MARLTQVQWRALIEKQAASGQTAMAFCAEHGIDNKYFSTRKKQLMTQSTESRFVAVTTKPLENQSIQLHIGAVQLCIPASVSPQWLVDVIKALA
ncbi:MAG: IS66 family insertion sequence element accessory protein TnpB [Cellvibrio sp.]|uniref:IS66 family insertion sequence element accessory protein TnpA n=1 Tax=Cellvibrio sp. TaxID=1965322 RepID=UPI0027158733|nr:IS66 family insertion sequence element accessory protein TnpB [Cellvibrio sp.]